MIATAAICSSDAVVLARHCLESTQKLNINTNNSVGETSESGVKEKVNVREGVGTKRQKNSARK